MTIHYQAEPIEFNRFVSDFYHAPRVVSLIARLVKLEANVRSCVEIVSRGIILDIFHSTLCNVIMQC